MTTYKITIEIEDESKEKGVYRFRDIYVQYVADLHVEGVVAIVNGLPVPDIIVPISIGEFPNG